MPYFPILAPAADLAESCAVLRGWFDAADAAALHCYGLAKAAPNARLRMRYGSAAAKLTLTCCALYRTLYGRPTIWSFRGTSIRVDPPERGGRVVVRSWSVAGRRAMSSAERRAAGAGTRASDEDEYTPHHKSENNRGPGVSVPVAPVLHAEGRDEACSLPLGKIEINLSGPIRRPRGGAPKGNRNALKCGLHTAEMRAFDKQLRLFRRAAGAAIALHRAFRAAERCRLATHARVASDGYRAPSRVAVPAPNPVAQAQRSLPHGRRGTRSLRPRLVWHVSGRRAALVRPWGHVGSGPGPPRCRMAFRDRLRAFNRMTASRLDMAASDMGTGLPWPRLGAG